MIVIWIVSFLLGISWAEECPEGMTSIGCSPGLSNALGCCPISKKPRGEWGEPPKTGGCKTPLLDEGGMCCWIGQGFDGTGCVGVPTCPPDLEVSGYQCVKPSCPDGMIRMFDGEHCCWPGQAWSRNGNQCVGEVQCPPGWKQEANTCFDEDKRQQQEEEKKRAEQERQKQAELQAEIKKQEELDRLQREKDKEVQQKAKKKRQQEQAIRGVFIPKGSFVMGCIERDDNCLGDEKPSHKETISAPFYMMLSEVTQGMYEQVMGKRPWEDVSCWGSNSSSFSADQPVFCVSWFDAIVFANELSIKQGLEPAYSLPPGLLAVLAKQSDWKDQNVDPFANTIVVDLAATGWRLPTEVEWEYAANGKEIQQSNSPEDAASNVDVAFPYLYSGGNQLDVVGWFQSNSKGTTNAVCQKQENGFGLCDMSGNVFEWVWDLYEADAYQHQHQHHHHHAEDTNIDRVLRGGDWGSPEAVLRITARQKQPPSCRAGSIGFRLVRKYQTKVIPKKL